MSRKATALPWRDVAQALHARQQLFAHRLYRGDAHGGGEDVVRRLASVHVVVGVDQARLAALAAEQLASAVGEHLVHVHVGLRSAAGLPHHQGKLAVVLAAQHFVGCGHDGARLLGVERSEIEVDQGRRLLHERQRVDERVRHAFAGDLEVLQRALGLGAPQAVGGDRHGTEGVFFDASGWCGHDRLMLAALGPKEMANFMAAGCWRRENLVGRTRCPGRTYFVARFAIAHLAKAARSSACEPMISRTMSRFRVW